MAIPTLASWVGERRWPIGANAYRRSLASECGPRLAAFGFSMIRWLWRKAVRRCPGYANLRSRLASLEEQVKGINLIIEGMQRKQQETSSRLAEWEHGAPHREYRS